MSRSFTSFTHRLERTPSHWAEISSSLLGATASVVAAAVVYQVITHALTPVSGLWWSLFGGLGMVAASRTGDAWGQISRALSGRVPTVEVENQPWRPGEDQRLRVANPDVSDLKALEVTLEADEFVLPGVRAATAATPFSSLLHREKVFSAVGDELVTIDYGLDLVARITLPPHAEGKAWRWRIMVRCRPHIGPLRQYWFALPVDATVAVRPAHASSGRRPAVA